MHIHQGHWSLSSSAWWTLLCNNQLIYILPSTAIYVDYWGKGGVRAARQCVVGCNACTRTCPSPAFCVMNWFDSAPHTCYTPPRRRHTHTRDRWGSWLCAHAALRSHRSLRRPPAARPSFVAAAPWHRSPVVKALLGCQAARRWKTLGPRCSLGVSAGQSLKALRCDGADWQLGSHARGYQGSVSRERGCHRSGSPN